MIPIPKSQDVTNPLNFRLISILFSLSKPLEKHIDKQLRIYFENNQLFYELQSGFRPLHSCHTALINMCESWLSAINDNTFVGSVSLDFKKAFDLVDHNILIDKLSIYLPVSPSIDIFKSYLSDRKQYVTVNGKSSSFGMIKTGVPQDSLLGPLLFLIYINDLPLHLDENIQTNIFADDTSLHVADNNIHKINNTLQTAIENVNEWCITNNMIIHPDKIKSIIKTPWQKQMLKPLNLSLTLNNNKIEQVSEHLVLGLKIDSNLLWREHLKMISKRLSKNTFLLSKLRRFASPPALKIFFDAHICSHINYSSTIWDGCSEDVKKLPNSVHRRAIKLIDNTPNLSTDEKYRKLKILPLDSQLQFNKACIIYKILNNKAPKYLTPLIKKASTRYGSCRLIPLLSRIDLVRNNSLACSGPALFNKLPKTIKKSNSLKQFKTTLYTFLKKGPIENH